MNLHALRLALICAALLGSIVVVRLVAWPLESVTLPSEVDSVVASRAVEQAPRVWADSGAGIATRDPFRVTRRPAFPAYDPLRLAEQLAPPPPRPVLVLVGVMEGVKPSAIIEGFPSVDGARVVRVGDVIAGLAIKEVARGRVVVTGMDTTWVLQVREPWKH